MIVRLALVATAHAHAVHPYGAAGHSRASQGGGHDDAEHGTFLIVIDQSWLREFPVALGVLKKAGNPPSCFLIAGSLY
jgi:hypothetical protein